MSKENKDKADAAETRSKQTKGFMQQVRVAARRKYTPEEFEKANGRNETG